MASDSTNEGLRVARASIADLHDLALNSLARMYVPAERLFSFRLRPGSGGEVREGLSLRYTAITLIGLAEEPRHVHTAVLGAHTLHDVGARLVADASSMHNLGDLALSLWAIRRLGFGHADLFERRIRELDPVDAPHATVEVAWLLAALCVPGPSVLEELLGPLARRLVAAIHPRSQLFPHLLGQSRARSHVSCFADLVYPIHALSTYSVIASDRDALAAAAGSATELCRRQGDHGQWWWHYDYRTGNVIEKYPVYAIHQDAMGPMALLELHRSGGPDCSDAIAKGVSWLTHSPELSGGSLVDRERQTIWRKVARREPRKLARYLGALASRVHPDLRVPALDVLFPARSIDWEDRPYHLGWLLYAWRQDNNQQAS